MIFLSGRGFELPPHATFFRLSRLIRILRGGRVVLRIPSRLNVCFGLIALGRIGGHGASGPGSAEGSAQRPRHPSQPHVDGKATANARLDGRTSPRAQDKARKCVLSTLFPVSSPPRERTGGTQNRVPSGTGGTVLCVATVSSPWTTPAVQRPRRERSAPWLPSQGTRKGPGFLSWQQWPGTKSDFFKSP